MIRLPDFVTKKDFEWAVQEATRKKKEDFSKVEFFTYSEGLCVQMMHIGAYDDEPSSIKQMDDFLDVKGYPKIIIARTHHEMYQYEGIRIEDIAEWLKN